MDLYGFENPRFTPPGERFGLQQVRPPSGAGASEPGITQEDITKEDVENAQELSKTRPGQVLAALVVQQDRKQRGGSPASEPTGDRLTEWTERFVPPDATNLKQLAENIVALNEDLKVYLSGRQRDLDYYIPGVKEDQGHFRHFLKGILASHPSGGSISRDVSIAYQWAEKADEGQRRDGVITTSELESLKPEDRTKVRHLAVLAKKVLPFYRQLEVERVKREEAEAKKKADKVAAEKAEKPKDPKNVDEWAVYGAKWFGHKAVGIKDNWKEIVMTGVLGSSTLKVVQNQPWCPGLLKAPQGVKVWKVWRYGGLGRGVVATGGVLGVGLVLYLSMGAMDELFEKAGFKKQLGQYSSGFLSSLLGWSLPTFFLKRSPQLARFLSKRSPQLAARLLPLARLAVPYLPHVALIAGGTLILHKAGLTDYMIDTSLIGFIADSLPQQDQEPQKFGQYALDEHGKPLKGEDGKPITYEEKSFQDYLKNLVAIRGSQGDEACLKALEAARDRDELRLHAAYGRNGGLKDGIKPLKPEFRSRLDTEIQKLNEATKAPETKAVAAGNGAGGRTKVVAAGRPSRRNGTKRNNGVAQAKSTAGIDLSEW